MSASIRATVEDHVARLSRIFATALASRPVCRLPIEAPGLVGRRCAEQLRSPTALPGFRNSQMDGFAVRIQDLGVAGGAATLPLSAVVPAGSSPPALAPGTAAAVMTGAPVPPEAEVVIPVEKSAEGFAGLELLAAGEPAQVRFRGLESADFQPNRFIRAAGSAVSAGDTLVQEGQPLTPARLGLLAACGFHRVPVMSRISTLVVSTGAELRAPGRSLGPGQLHDANSALLRAALESFGHSVSTLRVSSDDPGALLLELNQALALHRPHLVVTAGGVSAGAFEVVREALAGEDVEFAPIAQQPGGPQGWGLLSIPDRQAPAAFVGLPGNPVSCAVSVETLLRPALSSVDPECPAPRYVDARLGASLTSPAGIRQFRRVQLRDEAAGPPVAYPVGGPGSHLLGHYAQSDALLVLYEADEDVACGEVRPAALLP